MVIEDPPTIMQDLDLVAAQAGRSTSMEEPGVVLTELAHPEGEALPPIDAQVPVLPREVRADHVSQHPLGPIECTGLFHQV
jgi:hypothetical protein